MRIILNGSDYEAKPGQTLLALLADLSIDPARVAIELDRRIVKAPEWNSTTLQPGSRVEIVQFVGGG